MLASRLLGNLLVQLMLGDQSGFTRVSRRQPSVFAAATTDDAGLLSSVVVIPLLVMNLIGVDDAVDAALAVLTHRDELLVWILMILLVLHI